MINYVYCSTNPDQKKLAEGLLQYDFINPCPIYDQYSSGDYGCDIVSRLSGNIFIQWMSAISDLEKIAKPDWYFWVGPDYLNYLEHNRPAHVKYISNCYSVQQVLKNDFGINSRVIPRFGRVTEVKRKFLDFKKIRIGILDAWSKSYNHKQIYESLSNSLLKDFELFGNGQGEYKLHDNTLLDSEIKENCPFIRLCDFSTADMDVVIAGNFGNESNINSALRDGVPISSTPTMYALDLEKKYNCISLARGDNWGDAVINALSPKIISGRKQLSHLSTDEQMKNLFHNYSSKIDIRNKKIEKINVFGMFRNNEDSIGQTLSHLKINERNLNVPCDYYIYENDSNDDTPEQIKEFYRHSKGKYTCEVLGNKEHAGDSRPERLRDLAIYRNKMKALCIDWSCQYTFIIDSDIKFPPDIFIKMISTMESHKDCVMVTPFGTPEYNNEYYDIFAYLNAEGEKTPPSSVSISEVRSAFSGFACIRTNVFKKCHWNALADVSEHIFFCDMVRQYGKIVIDPSIRVEWKKKINVTLSKAKTKEYILIDGRCVENETRGIGRYAVDFINSLISLDVDYEIFVNQENELTKRLNTNRFTKITNLESQIDSRNADAYITISAFSPKSEPINANNLKSNIKTYCIMHDIIPIRMNFLKDWSAEGVKEYFDKLDVIKNYTATLSNSEFTARDCIEYLPNIKHLGAGVNPDIKKLILPRPIREKYIFAQTAYDPHKGFDTLLQGYKNLDSQIKQSLKLVIGSDIELQEEGVYVTGRLSDEDLSNYHHHAWLFVCPSQYEGFGLPILEAWLHDNPVIAAKNSSLIEVIGNNEWLFNNDELTQKITQLYEDENYYNECKKYSSRYKDFMWIEVAKKFIKLIQ